MIKFGTGGWRAIIGDEFIKTNIELLAQSIADEINENNYKKEFVISYDRRFLSRESATWISQVLTANEIKVFFINYVCPTPMTMHTVRNYGVDFGAAITASHNGALYNGVKVFTKGGLDATQEFTDKLEKRMQNIKNIKNIEYTEAEVKGLLNYIDPQNAYIDEVLSLIDVEAIKNKNLKVMVDPMHGVSAKYLQMMLAITRCDCKIIHDWHDTLFGKRVPTPTKESLGRLQYHLTNEDYDIGIGSDGDGDRLAVIDEKGNFVHPNMILSLLYYYMLQYKGLKGPVVRNMSTTHMLDIIADSFGQKAYEVPVGFKHISSGMEKYGCIIGGESSGGLTIEGHIKGKDAMFATLLFLEMIAIIDKPISEMIEDLNGKFGKMFFLEKSFTIKPELKEVFQSKLFIEKELPHFEKEIIKISYEDGLKIYFRDGWVTCRFSGTEPVIRVFAEMDTEKDLMDIENTFLEFLNIR